MRGVLAAAFALAVLGPPPPLRGEPSGPAHLVSIDVIPADARGRILDDLVPGDFELSEEGALQTLEGVRFIRVAGGPPAGAPVMIGTEADERQAAAGDDTRLVAIFLARAPIAPARR
jgi:hypothetical protein